MLKRGRSDGAEGPLLSPIIGLLLAGGSARRFGRQKLLEPLGEDTCVAGLACRKLVQATDRVIAVVRPEAQELGELLSREGAQVIACADSYRGMGATLAHGVCASKGASGWLIALADMPFIRLSTLTALTKALRLGPSVVMPSWQGRQGHPVGFGARHRDRLLGLSGDEGGRSILDAHREECTVIQVQDPGILLDIDVEEDLLHGLRLLSAGMNDEP